jgi:DNA polymerase-3 subunit delta
MASALRDIRARLEAESWPPAILLAGDDEDAIGRALSIIAQALPDEERDTACDRFAEGPLAPALDAARTRPLLGGRRIVIAREPEGLGARGGQPARDALLRYLDAPPPHALLVLVVRKLDKRLAVVKRIAKAGLVVELSQPRERDMPGWIAGRAREGGLELPPQAVQALADAVGRDTALAARELDKLRLLAEERAAGARPTRVSAEAVAASLGPHRAVGAFALEDAILEGRAGDAFEALARQLHGQGVGEALPLLGRLAWIARRLSVARKAASGGEERVREALGCHPFVAKKYYRASRGRAGASAAAALASCVRADGELKSSGDPRAALENVLLAFLGRERAP